MSLQRAYLQAILLWRFEAAPEKFQRLTKHAGSWVLITPKGVELPHWFRASAFVDFGRVESYPIGDGDVCYIAFPEEPQSHLPL